MLFQLSTPSVWDPSSFASFEGAPLTLITGLKSLDSTSSLRGVTAGTQGTGHAAEPEGCLFCCGQIASQGPFKPGGLYLDASKGYSEDAACVQLQLRMKNGIFKQLQVKKWSTVAQFWKHLKAAMK